MVRFCPSLITMGLRRSNLTASIALASNAACLWCSSNYCIVLRTFIWAGGVLSPYVGAVLHTGLRRRCPRERKNIHKPIREALYFFPGDRDGLSTHGNGVNIYTKGALVVASVLDLDLDGARYQVRLPAVVLEYMYCRTNNSKMWRGKPLIARLARDA